METINKDQIKSIHILLAKRKDPADAKNEMKRWFQVESTKDLTYKQANEAIVILGGEKFVNHEHIRYGRFQLDNLKHRKILSLCKEIGWTTINPNTKRIVADIERLGSWLKKYGFLHKPLIQYDNTDLSKLIKQFENVVDHHLSTPKPCQPPK